MENRYMKAQCRNMISVIAAFSQACELAALEDDRKIEGILISVTPVNHSLFLAVRSNTLDALPLIWSITTPCSLLLTSLILCRSGLILAWQMG